MTQKDAMTTASQVVDRYKSAARAVWSEPGQELVRFLKRIARKYNIRLEGLNPTRVAAAGNRIFIQYESSVRPMPAGWQEEVGSEYRVQQILKKWDAATPEEVTRKSQEEFDRDIDQTRREWERISRQIESDYSFGCEVSVNDTRFGPMVGLTISGRLVEYR